MGDHATFDDNLLNDNNDINLLNDNVDLHMSNLGTLVSGGP